MNVSLTPELDRYVHSKVETGRYSSASEVLREALRLMQERDEARELQLNEVRLSIQNGIEDLQNGRYIEGTSADLYKYALRRSRSQRGPQPPVRMDDAEGIIGLFEQKPQIVDSILEVVETRSERYQDQL